MNRDSRTGRASADGRIVKRIVVIGILTALGGATALAQKETDRLQNSAIVMKEILGMPDSIPKDLLDRAECVIVVPSVNSTSCFEPSVRSLKSKPS